MEEIVISEAINKGLALLEQLAAKIGVTVDYLWPFMVREQIIGFCTAAVLFVLGVAGMVFAGRKIDISVLSTFYEGEKNKLHHGIFVGIGIAAAIATFVGFLHMGLKINGLLNPQYHAFKDLVMMIK